MGMKFTGRLKKSFFRRTRPERRLFIFVFFQAIN
jgi:hypothetical protein